MCLFAVKTRIVLVLLVAVPSAKLLNGLILHINVNRMYLSGQVRGALTNVHVDVKFWCQWKAPRTPCAHLGKLPVSTVGERPSRRGPGRVLQSHTHSSFCTAPGPTRIYERVCMRTMRYPTARFHVVSGGLLCMSGF